MALGIPFEQLNDTASHYLFILVRVAALLHVAPVFTEKSISIRLRAGLALAVAVVMGGVVPDSHAVLYSWTSVWILLKQVVIGAAMGLTMQLLFAAVRLAGEMTGMQMGLSFATFFDPGTGNSPVVARFLNLLVTLLFLSFNGHLWLLYVLADSFRTLPVNAAPLNAGGLMALVTNAGLIFSQGLMLGLPVIALLLCINIILGILNRLTPQLSVFVIGFPLMLSLGMLTLILLIRTSPHFFEHLMARGFDLLGLVIQALR